MEQILSVITTQQISRGALRILGPKLRLLCREPLDPAQCPEAVRRSHDWVCLRHAGHDGQHMAWAVRDSFQTTQVGSIATILVSSSPTYVWFTRSPLIYPPDFSTLKAELAWLQGAT